MTRLLLQKISTAGLALVLVSSCTKSLPFIAVPREAQTSSKDLVDTMDASKGKQGAVYLYVPSSDVSSRTAPEASGATPYWQGTEKMVKFQFTENELRVLQVDNETRFASNPANLTLVMAIPVEHVEFRCAQDRKGDCQQKEEKNNDISWDQKSQFVPDFNKMNVVEANLLPVEMDIVFGQSCYKEQSSRFVNYTLTDKAMNIQVEKVFQADVPCLEKHGAEIRNLSDLTTTVIYHYSFVKIDSLASPDYKPISYRAADQDAFGFFDTNIKKLDVDANATLSGQSTLLNRWNPNRKSVTYYLSKEFNKPENQNLIAPTQKAFAAINDGLAKAGVDLVFNLETSTDLAPGDIRNSMIVLVEDPIAAGPLGYGPTVADPRTGEILSGRVVMYSGNLIQSISRTYDDIVKQQLLEQKAAQNPVVPVQAALPTPAPGAAKNGFALTSSVTKAKTASQVAQLIKSSSFAAAKAVPSVQGGNLTKLGSKNIRDLNKSEVRNLMNSKKTNSQSSGTDYLSAMSKYCNYPSELFNFSDSIKKALHGKLAVLKPWIQLSASEKQSVIDIVVPEVWVPILVHELGHNLGFRHNFNGSEDKANFYSTQELTGMGVTYPINYSSVMDYALSDLNALPTLGKYDIAALRFGYRREIELSTGDIKKIDTDLEDLNAKLGVGSNAPNAPEWKPYMYCSDEHVDVNPGCKRFDEGTTITEIVQNQIATYHEFYSVRNKRNLMASFSTNQDAKYAGRMLSRFTYIRAPKERYEEIKAKYNLADDAPEWNDIGFLKDLKTATLLSGQFFMDVIEEPDVSCAVADAKDLNKIVEVDRIDTIDSKAMSCFDIVLPDSIKDKVKIVGQTGKFFNSRKDANSHEAYERYQDQIDIRGIWIDKVIAADMLFSRILKDNSLYNETLGSYIDIPELKPKILGMVKDMVTDNVARDLNFSTPEGDSFTVKNVGLDMFGIPGVDAPAHLSHFIAAPPTDEIVSALDIPNHAVSYQTVLLEKMNRELLIDPRTAAAAKPVAASIQVYRAAPVYQPDNSVGSVSADVNTIRYVALPQNSLAFEIITVVNQADLLKGLSADEIKQALDAVTKVVPPAKVVIPDGTKPNLVAAYNLPLDVLQAASVGHIPDTSRLQYILSILPGAAL